MLLVFVGSNAQTANQLIREGNKLFSSKNYAQAEILYHKAIDKDGSNAIANYNLGRCLQAQKKNEEAKKLYVNAAKLEKDPVRLSSSYNNLGTILQDEKNYEKAIDLAKSIHEGESFDYTKGIITTVDADLTRYRKKLDKKMVRKNLTIPSWMNVEAKRLNLNISRVLQDALEERFHALN